MLVCTDCQPPLVRNSRSQEHCARKCKKVKKNFNCRWVCLSRFPWNQLVVSPRPFNPLPLLLCRCSIYIFLLFIICPSLNDFPCVSTGLSTFSGITGNATCFPLTGSPTVRRSRPTLTLLCMKKKVNVAILSPLEVDFQSHSGVFSHENIQVQGRTGKLFVCDCRLCFLHHLSLGFLRSLVFLLTQ